MKSMSGIVDRFKHLWTISKWGLAPMEGVWTLVCSADTLVTHLASDLFQKKWNGWWHPHLGWDNWLIGVLIIFAMATVEGSFRHSRKLSNQLNDAECKLQKIENSRPNIVLCDPNARHVQEILCRVSNSPSEALQYQFVKVRFINRQKAGQSVAKAIGIRAKIEFFNESGELILRMDGRWDSSKHPQLLGTGENFNDLLRMDFDVEQEENVDIAFWTPRRRQFFAFNNDSYQRPLWEKEEHQLGHGPVRATIRLVGQNFDRTFDVRFGINTAATVEILG